MKKTSIIIGLSGGVDSAMAAVNLKDQGFHVEGLYINNGCLSTGRAAAENVAERVGIPFHMVDGAVVFKREIVDYFVGEYRDGRTPNPCIVCNKRFKFRTLIEEANRRGIELIATGHYARVRFENGFYRLCRGTDPKKDQSYFLSQLGQEELSRMILPNAVIAKHELKKQAAALGFPALTTKESQEVCFIPDNDYRTFLENSEGALPSIPGNIIDTTGKIVGRHRGIHSITIGQRRGLNIASERPYYVVAIDSAENKVIVGRDEEQFFTGLVARDVSWVSEERNEGDSFRASTQIRYRNGGADSTVILTKQQAGEGQVGTGLSATVQFDTPQKAVAPGQAAVFYDGDAVIGGGWIERGCRHG
ncbi:MAG: tRNA 2-thiouridine(34) synthase MnmA [Deltaproteobacteria bacterium]|nr:tRNA 2-thiouridine(34) synthase MnmA [Deltaproteobacteria bacterium]